MMTRKPDDRGPGDAPGFRPRRATRIDVSDVEASLTDVYKVEIKIRNVSTAGFMAECAAPVRIGAYVTLDIPGIGPVEAQVRWQIGIKMGGMFLDPISLGRCEWAAEKAEAPAAA
jgi:hypothetical protein